MFSYHSPVAILSMAFVLLTSGLPRHSGADSAKVQSVSIDALEAIAKNAVAEELSLFNASIASPDMPTPSYPKKLIKQALADLPARVDRIEFNELFDKCTYSESDLVQLVDSTLTESDDAIAAKRNNLANVRQIYSKSVWKLFSIACLNARTRFEARLKRVTAGGHTLGLTETEIKSISSVLFFPTAIGAPSNKETVIAVFNGVVSAALIVGPAGALLGFPVGATLIMTTTMTSSSFNLWNQLNPPKVNFPRIQSTLESAKFLNLDLSEDEARFIVPSLN